MIESASPFIQGAKQKKVKADPAFTFFLFFAAFIDSIEFIIYWFTAAIFISKSCHDRMVEGNVQRKIDKELNETFEEGIQWKKRSLF